MVIYGQNTNPSNSTESVRFKSLYSVSSWSSHLWTTIYYSTCTVLYCSEHSPPPMLLLGTDWGKQGQGYEVADGDFSTTSSPSTYCTSRVC